MLSPDQVVDAPEPSGSPEPLPDKCGAKNQSRPGYCIRDPMANGRCYRHGGPSLVGIASPSFKTGRHSKYLPGRLAERSEEAQRDPDRLALRDEIALLAARVNELLQRAHSGESGQLWVQLQSRWRDFERFRASGDVKNMQLALETFAEPLSKGVADHAAWTEIGQLQDRRQRLVEAERRRLEQTQQTLTVEEAMGLLRTVLDVIKRNVTDRTVLSRIATELASLVTLDAVPLAVAGRGKRRRT